MVFGPARVAVFIDGCFWHGCPEHGRQQTKANPEFWRSKMARNQLRDADTDRRQEAAGWLSIRV